ncbi:quinate pathway repressor [Trichoderma arundinaceum]|uniref:Quinate pathway repressor n=1 Tax=Trichoderma arundinaceum TaxID=490622 RepID=A0A395NVP0_TRIAR|nr:quinate pathway repressor [Trichoderma arundinaceum]
MSSLQTRLKGRQDRSSKGRETPPAIVSINYREDDRAQQSRAEITCQAARSSSNVREDTKSQRPTSISDTASIVFTGPRGNGKSSLAVISGLLLRRRVVDVDADFIATHGVSKTGFKRKYGAENLRLKELETTRTLLMRYDKGCVIACGPQIAAEQLRGFMTEYRKTHAVIYVTRSVDDIENYLGVKERGKMQQWMKNIQGNYHQVSNFEFFNLPERWDEQEQQSPALKRLQYILSHRLVSQRKVHALQGTQTALARFLAVALGYNASSLSHDIFPTIYPSLPERRVYSNSMRISVTALATEKMTIGEIPAGADVVEMVLDARDPRCSAAMASGMVGRFMAEIRRFLAVPIVYDVCMANKDINDWPLYFGMLYDGLRLAPEYLTVDLDATSEDIQQLTLRRGCTTILGNQDTTVAKSDFWLSSEPLVQYNRAAQLGCGVVRLTKPCHTTGDNFSCLTFIEKVKALPDGIPVIAYNTGDKENTQIEDVLPRPTTLSIRERWGSLFDMHILHHLEFFLVGSVKNSLSPAMHNAAFQILGMPHVYNTHEAKDLEELCVLLSRPNFGGASVSLPLKKDVLTLIQRLSPSAELIGASNTILPVRGWKEDLVPSDPRCKEYRHRAGPVTMLYGDNTDWIGICACLSRSISPANSVNHETTGLVIGAGGMARAAVYCLLYLGVRNICIFNRTVSRAQAVRKHYEQVFGKFSQSKSQCSPQTTESAQSTGLRITVLESIDIPWPSNFCQPNIVICAIKAYDNHLPATRPFTMPPAWMKSPTGGVIVELAYHTPETPLMRQLREGSYPGWSVVDPVEVLFEQACAQWELFTGSRAPRKTMWEACLNQYANAMERDDYQNSKFGISIRND